MFICHNAAILENGRLGNEVIQVQGKGAFSLKSFWPNFCHSSDLIQSSLALSSPDKMAAPFQTVISELRSFGSMITSIGSARYIAGI